MFHLGAGGVASLLERGEGQDRRVRGAVGQAQGRLCREEKVSHRNMELATYNWEMKQM